MECQKLHTNPLIRLFCHKGNCCLTIHSNNFHNLETIFWFRLIDHSSNNELLTNEKIPCCYALLFIIHKLLRGCKRSYSVKLLPVLITAPHQFNYLDNRLYMAHNIPTLLCLAKMRNLLYTAYTNLPV